MTKLKDIVNLIRPQVNTDLEVRDYKTGAILYNGPAHLLTGAESFCKYTIKEIAIENGNYIIKVAK